jgi:cysteine desulfurase
MPHQRAPYPYRIAIYLDNNATTQPLPAAADAMLAALTQTWHNPSSVHRGGQAARAGIELARAEVAQLLAVRAREVTFTSSGTESIDLAIRGSFAAWRLRAGPKRLRLVTTKIEHAAVRDLAAELAETAGVVVEYTEVSREGVIDLESLRSILGADPEALTLVSVQWANNETGSIQPVEMIYSLCEAHGAIFHCDAVQWVGKMPVDLVASDERPHAEVPSHRHGRSGQPPCDLLSCSAHKFHGPKGVGVLWVRTGMKLRPMLHGTQELGRRAGTENVPGIVGAGIAAADARQWLSDPSLREAVATMRDKFERRVLAACPESVVIGPVAQPHSRLWNTTNIAFARLEAEAILMGLSERGVYASAGAACSSGSLDPSPVLLAMGVPPAVAHGAVRFSLSRFTTESELDQAAAVISDVVAKLRSGMPGH